MKKMLLALALGAGLVAVQTTAQAGFFAQKTEADVISLYSKLVLGKYTQAHKDALSLQAAVDAFLADPAEQNLARARQAWLKSRDSYGQTEAFRFYEGPIDFAGKDGLEGPEGRLNAWPLDEAYIDYVKDNPKSGIVNNPGVDISKESLSQKNQADDEADVATGYHAIEFLLWGQDFDANGPGARAATDYTDTPENQRRRQYLKVVTDLLVDDLKFLEDAWAPEQDNYARIFAQDKDAMAKILTGLATLSGFELASERMATALDSGDQEDEHSCFSDNTHNDFIANQRGIYNVFFQGGLYPYLKAKNHDLAEEMEKQILTTSKMIGNLPHPIDREILASPPGSPARAQMEEAIAALQRQAELFKQAGQVLGLDVQILQ